MKYFKHSSAKHQFLEENYLWELDNDRYSVIRLDHIASNKNMLAHLTCTLEFRRQLVIS